MSLILSALLALSATRGSVDASARLQVRGRDGAALTGPALDAEAGPELRIAVRSRRWEITTDYAARFSRTVLGADATPSVLQQGSLAARFHDRRTSLSVIEDVGYGSTSFTALASEPGAAAGPLFHLASLPRTDSLQYAWSRTALLGRLAVSRRWTLTPSLDYSFNGGTDTLSRAAMPFQTTVHSGLGAERSLSRRSQLTSTADLSRSVFSSGWDDTLLQGTLSWRRSWERTLVTTVTGGAGWSTSHNGVTGSHTAGTHPVVTATVAYSPGASSLDAALSARLAPVIDRMSGRVDERMEGIASLTWKATRDLGIEGQLGAARSIFWSEPDAVALVYQGLTASYRASDLLKLEGGARGAWTRLRGDAAPPLQWLTFVGVTFTAPTLRF